jgi:serine/threonine-protein kinase
VSGLNPLVERAILRCLERDPERRPVSAAALAAALPGGDPLAMAIAAGDTPSPEMVAAAGSDAGLRPTVARLLFGTALAGMAATALLAGNLSANGVAASGKPPVVLVERARELLRAAGFPERAQDSGWGFERNWAYLNWPGERRVAHGLDGQAAHAMVFWYRESPVLLERKNFAEPYLLSALWPFDPQLAYSGEVLLRLDREGRLRSLTAIPPQRPAAHDDRGQMNWAALFEAAGLDPTAWRSDEPVWTPVYYGDERVAWVPDGEATGDVIRVEGASFRGRPVHFALIHPWTVAERDAGTRRTAAQQMSDLAGILLLSGMMAAAVLIARRNLRLDRADRRGAVRLAAVAMALTAVAWLLAEHHIPSIWQLYLVISAAGWTLFCGTLVAAFYLALEPYVRRTWPATIISWSRAIAGATHDSLVARDVLIGCAAAAVVGLSEMSAAVVTQAATGLLPLVDVSPAPLLGLRHASSSILMTTVWCVFQAFFYLMLLLGLRKVLRAEWAAILASALVMGGLASLATPAPAMTLPFLLLGEIALFTLLARVGVLATIAALFVLYTLVPFPSAWPPTAWHSGIGLMGIAVTAALAAAAFRFASSSRVRHVGTQPGSTR